ncbi:MAG: caspase family protein [Pseudolabrys sp.]|jgi:hypothetical protein
MPRKKACLVGINNYANPKYALAGCLNDIDSLSSLLKDCFGFSENNITTLTDAAATRAGILAGLSALLEGAAAGDTLIFAYSGHGCQKPSTAPGTQPNDMNDALVPYEATYASLITDEELYNLITHRIMTPAIKFTAIYDCCHSGTMIRDVGFDPDTGMLVTAIENRCIFLPELQTLLKRAVNVGPYNVFSACGDAETAADVRSVPDERRARGAFSYAIHKLLRTTPAMTVGDLDIRAKAVIQTVSPHVQNPEFYAVNADAPVFS